jgi:hypothetical protein
MARVMPGSRPSPQRRELQQNTCTSSTIFQYRLHKIGKKTIPALDFAEMRIDLGRCSGGGGEAGGYRPHEAAVGNRSVDLQYRNHFGNVVLYLYIKLR